jgi:amino acid adenylation domain-containing protein
VTRFLHDYVAQQAQIRPDETAVVLGDETLTYGQLDDLSSRLARQLREAGCRPGDRVCLFVPKSPRAVAAMLGVLKAGAVYVPIDTASPAPRAARIVEACRPWGALVASGALRLLDEVLQSVSLDPLVVGALESQPLEGRRARSRFTLDDVHRMPRAAAYRPGSDEAAAHILFTSGSTGVPKGVVISHRNVTAFVDWGREYFGIRPGDRNSGHPPLHFDLSTFDIYGTLSAGAQLHMVPSEANLLPQRLAQFIGSARLTQWFSVPSILTFLAKHDVIAPGDFPHLRRLLWCGEVLPTPTLIYLMQRLPHVSFTNLYGPTEATIASSYYTVPACPSDERAAIPIGVACPGEQLMVLDGELRELPPEETGELYLAGVGLSSGYWNDPEKTAAAFRIRTLADGTTQRVYRTGDLARRGTDGLFYFLGRADSQIKCRGYRIELGEIEAALHALQCLRECAVVAIPTDGFEGTAICCAFVPQDGSEITAATLRQRVAQVLPAYMLPMRWRALESLPKNANGKIDRPRLREMFQHDLSA